MNTSTINESIMNRVIRVTYEVLRIDENEITQESRFVEDLGADSLDRLTLLMSLEDEFGRPIPEEAASRLTTVASVVSYVESFSACENWKPILG